MVGFLLSVIGLLLVIGVSVVFGFFIGMYCTLKGIEEKVDSEQLKEILDKLKKI